MVFTGQNAGGMRAVMSKYYIPNKIILGGMVENLPLLQGKISSQSRIYICKDKTCGLPVSGVAEALKQINH